MKFFKIGETNTKINLGKPDEGSVGCLNSIEYQSFCSWSAESRMQRIRKRTEAISVGKKVLDVTNHVLSKKTRLREVQILDDKIIRLDDYIDQAEVLIIDDCEACLHEKSVGESIKEFFRSFFNVHSDEDELQAMRREIRERIELEGLDIHTLAHDFAHSIALKDIVRVVRDVLVDCKGAYIEIKIKVENDLARVRVRLDLRHRIRYFIDKMYRYHNGDDEEESSYKINATSHCSFIYMNFLNPLRHAIKNRNAGVFGLPLNNT